MYNYTDHQSKCPMQSVIDDCLSSGTLSPELQELRAILGLLRKAIPISDRPSTEHFNPVESCIQITKRELGSRNPMAVKIERLLLKFSNFYTRSRGGSHPDRR